MKALQSITDMFKKHVVESKNFNAWAEDGALFCTQGAAVDGYELEYTVIIFMTSVNIKPHILMMHLVNWLNVNDIDRAEKGLGSPIFAVELLDKDLCDIKIKLDIREEYELHQSENGDWKQYGERFDCISTFKAKAKEDDFEQLEFVRHPDDLPCD